MPFLFKKLEIPDVVVVEPRVFTDERGFFLESYKKTDFIENGINYDFVQDNHSLSGKGVVRGLHFQLDPRAQGKLVRVVRGAVWDVAVDLRKDSPHYLKWVSCELSEDNHSMLFIPPGFGHGFASLTENVHLLYKCTDEYDPHCDSGIRWDDPDIGVKWPVENPVISEKDDKLPFVMDVKNI